MVSNTNRKKFDTTYSKKGGVATLIDLETKTHAAHREIERIVYWFYGLSKEKSKIVKEQS